MTGNGLLRWLLDRGGNESEQQNLLFWDTSFI